MKAKPFSCLPLCSQGLEQCLTYNRCWSSICWKNECVTMASHQSLMMPTFSFVQLERWQDMQTSALQEESMVLGPSSGSVINCDHGRDIPLPGASAFSFVQWSCQSRGLFGSFQLGCQWMKLDWAILIEFQDQQQKMSEASNSATPFKWPHIF